MRKELIILLCMVELLLTTCHKSLKVEKDVQNYYPKVKTLSAQKLRDGTVKVTGLIVSTGSTPVEYVGFCMDTLPGPAMLSNQRTIDTLHADTFSYIYSGLEFPKKYYFRAWVANGSGYVIGADVFADSITFDPALIPCQPPLQHLILTNSTSNLDYKYSLIYDLTSTGTQYGISAYAEDHSIDLTFEIIPTSGIYYNGGTGGHGNQRVLINVDHMEFSDPCNVYVRQVDAHVAEITICSLPVSLSSGIFTYTYTNYNLTTRFRATIR